MARTAETAHATTMARCPPAPFPRPVIPLFWPSLPSPVLPWFGAALGVAALSALALAYTVRKLHSRDRVVAAAWGLGGAVGVGSGWWASQTLALLALGVAKEYRGDAVFASWLLAMSTLAGVSTWTLFPV